MCRCDDFLKSILRKKIKTIQIVQGNTKTYVDYPIINKRHNLSDIMSFELIQQTHGLHMWHIRCLISIIILSVIKIWLSYDVYPFREVKCFHNAIHTLEIRVIVMRLKWFLNLTQGWDS